MTSVGADPILYVATSNRGKLREFQLGIEMWTQQSSTGMSWPNWIVDLVPNIASIPECAEDGDTFSLNARKKALHYSSLANGLVLGDDSGLDVDALNGRPGVWSRRYAGPDASDDENNAKLLRELSAVSGANRGAQFVCVLAIAQGDQIVAEFRGEARGVILASPRGSYGFGYDPLFLDPEFGKTFAEMSPQEKLQRSHRGKAMHAMMDWLGQRRK